MECAVAAERFSDMVATRPHGPVRHDRDISRTSAPECEQAGGFARPAAVVGAETLCYCLRKQKTAARLRPIRMPAGAGACPKKIVSPPP